MPWLPEFANAVELARAETRTEGQADPVGQYFAALNQGDTRALETVWPGHVVVYDPAAGKVRGHGQLRRFVRQNQAWMAEHHARTQTVATTYADGRAVVEMLAHVDHDGRDVAWPIAVVAESPDERSVVFRTYCSQWPHDGRRYHLRPAILPPGPAHPGDVVGRYQAALAAGDTEAIVSTFAPDGCYREPIGPHSAHRGTDELRSFFATQFSHGGIGLQHCMVTDDGVRCALEYNCVRWGGHDLPPQAGIGIYERGPDGLLVAARIYDDIEAPVEHP
jgi:ketosteroid isomerase-like protein